MSFTKIKPDGAILVGPVRFSFAHVFEKAKSMDGGEGKYSVSCIIPKSDKQTIEILTKAIEQCKKSNADVFGGKIPANLRNPLRDGDEDRPDDDIYADSMFFNATATRQPVIQVRESDATYSEALDEGDFYSGCYGAIYVNPYAYNKSGNRGISFGMSQVIKTKDGKKLGGSKTYSEAEVANDLNDLDDDLPF